MAILTLNDLPQGVFSSSDASRLIVSSQRMAEGPLGANRPLEVTEFVEILPVAKVMQTTQLRYWPIAETPTPVIEIRQSSTFTYGRSHGTSEWHTLDSSEYILDATGKLHLNKGLSSGFNRSASCMSDEVRATYTSGFDFTSSLYEVEQIKSAVLAIAIAQNSQQYQSNVSSVKIDDEASVSYGSSGGSGSSSPTSILSNPSGLSLTEAMMFLKKYKPRSCT